MSVHSHTSAHQEASATPEFPRHVVTAVLVSHDGARWLPDALAGLPGKIPELRAYHFGTDARINVGNYDFVVTADFDDEAGYLAYRDHPEHRAVADTLIVPHITDRAAVQFAC